MTELDATFGSRVWEAFLRRVVAGPVPMERLPFEGRAFVRDVRGRRCYWLEPGGLIEHAIVGLDVMEAPRGQLAYNAYCPEPVDEDRLVVLATDALWKSLEVRMLALAAVARIEGTEVGPDNTRLFAFGGLLTKSWTEEGDHYEAGRLDVGAVVRGRVLAG